MNDEKLKSQLGSNIAQYRKSSGMTQAKLAEQLNYSDKAVSKWERGESMPDVVTLVQLAELFGVSVDQVDVLVEGPFLLAGRSLELKYCGSRNQRLVDVQKSLAAGEIIRWQPPVW